MATPSKEWLMFWVLGEADHLFVDTGVNWRSDEAQNISDKLQDLGHYSATSTLGRLTAGARQGNDCRIYCLTGEALPDFSEIVPRERRAQEDTVAIGARARISTTATPRIVSAAQADWIKFN